MDALLYEIQQSIADLKTLAEQCDGKLEVWTYANPPLFRLVLINNERVFVNFYGAKEHMGVDTPQLVFLKSDVSFFIPFLGLYERMLAGSTRVV